MKSWFKLSTTFWTSPKSFQLRRVCGRSEARFHRAAMVFQVVLGIHTEAELDGVLTGPLCDSEMIRVRAGGMTDQDVRRAFDDLTAAGFIEAKRGTKRLRIVGWDHTWRAPMTEAERARRSRAKV